MESLPTGYLTDSVLQLETNLDDCTAEALGYAAEKLRASGALDVWITPIQMKKNRPGHLLSALCEHSALESLVDILFRETSAFGLRIQTVTRLKLRRDFVQVPTPYGSVTVKRGFRGNELVRQAPEYESCRDLAEKRNVPLPAIFDAAQHAAQFQAPPPPSTL
jgi:uncharacterized protein (DUF111 family)